MESPDYLWTSRRAYTKLAKPDGENLYWTTDVEDELPIIMKTTGPASVYPVSIYQILAENAQTVGQKIAMRVMKNKKWVNYTWVDVHNTALQVARALIHLGVPERKSTNIIGFNAPEWVLAFFGSAYANCVPVGVYTTSQTDACFYVADHSEAQVIFAQNELHAKKYLPVLDRLPNVKAIVCYWPTAAFETFREGRKNIYTWEEFLALGKQQYDPMVRIRNISPAAPVTIVYTSGTTGPPKGVMLSHDNYIYIAKTILSLEAFIEDEKLVSYLPLSHSAAQACDIFVTAVGRFTVTFADENALHGSLAGTLKATRPSAFLGVPRVYEKIEEGIRAIAAKTGGFKRSLAMWAKGIGYRASLSQMQGQSNPWGFALANSLVLSKVKQALGFDRVKVFLVSAAPVAKSTLEFFLALNIPIFNLYGMSECAGPTTINHPSKNNIWSAGYPLPGTDMRVLDSKNNAVPAGTRGELCFRGRNKFLGYYKSAKESREAIDAQGFIHSGDEAYMDPKGFVFITGRFKELIITAGGENIPPVIIEDQIKVESKLISNVILIGDARKYLSALITLKNVPTADGSPSDQLAPEAIAILQAAGSQATTVTAAIGDPKTQALVEKAIATANKRATSQAQYVRKWKLIPRDFSIPGGELTPTLKLKRKVVIEMYKADIESLYTDAKL